MSVIVTQDNETGTILAVGGPELLTETHWGDRVVSLDNQFVTPGFWDSHVHLLEYGRSFSRLKFASGDSLGDILARVQATATAVAPGGWIVGSGWNRQSLRGRPHGTQLDQAAPGRAVLLISLDYHSAWVNTLAAQRLGLEKPPSDGILREGEAFRAQEEVARFSNNDPGQAVQQAVSSFSRLGFVGVTAMEHAEGFRALQRRTLAGEQSLRVNLFLRDVVGELEHLGIEANYGSTYLRILGIKLFADGALGSHTAWMTSPYEGADQRGTAVLSPEQLQRWVERLSRDRLVPAIHAIGDQAVLDTAQALAEGEPWGVVKARIEHAQLMTDEAIDILSHTPGIALSMQPVHLLVDRAIAEQHWGARARHAFRLRDIIDRGIVAAFGSDAPIADPNPVLGLWSAVHRAEPGDTPWYPEQRLTAAEAVWCYTRGAALADGRPSGLIAPGYWGDLTLWRQNPQLALEQGNFDQLRVTGTVVGGRRVR